MISDYVLVTPAKDEEKTLPSLIKSISKQDLKPKKWLIVNDNSSDRTLAIIKKTSQYYEWIEHITIRNNKYEDLTHKRIGYVCKIGFEKLISMCNQENIEFDYIGKVDSDMLFPTYYFRKLVENLDRNSEIGLIGGNLKIRDESGNIHTESNSLKKTSNCTTRGTGILLRKKAFKGIGGWPLDDDFAVKIMIKENNWEIQSIEDLVYWQTRRTGEKKSLKSGYFSRGERAYYSYVNLLSVLMNILSYFFHEEKQIQKAIYFLLGYFKAFINRIERTENELVKKHNGSYRLFFERLIKHI